MSRLHASPAVTISGSTRLTWGINLGAKANFVPPVAPSGATGNVRENPNHRFRHRRHGFRSSSTLFFSLTLCPPKTRSNLHKSSGVYAEILLRNLECALPLGSLSGETLGELTPTEKQSFSVEATLRFYGAYLTIGKNPTFSKNFAKLWPLFITTRYKEADTQYAPGFGDYGGKIGYRVEDVGNSGLGFDFGFLSFASNGDWSTSGTSHSKYGFGSDLSLWYKRNKKLFLTVELAGNATLQEGYATLDSRFLGAPNNKRAPHALLWSVGGRLSIMPGAGFRFILATDAGNTYRDTNSARARVVEQALKFAEKTYPSLRTVRRIFSWMVQHVDSLGIDALVTAQWRWLSGGVYGATGAASVFGSSPFVNSTFQYTDFAAFLRLETRSGDDYTHALHGLNAGIEARVYLPLTYKSYLDNGGLPPDVVPARGVAQQVANIFEAGLRNIFGFFNRAVNFVARAAGLPADAITTGAASIALPIMGNAWVGYRIPCYDSMWIEPRAHIYMATNRFNFNGFKGTHNLKGELCFQYAVELRASPIKHVEFSVRWEQGLLSQDPYMLIEENWSWPGYTGSLFLECKITW